MHAIPDNQEPTPDDSQIPLPRTSGLCARTVAGAALEEEGRMPVNAPPRVNRSSHFGATSP